MPSSRFIPRRPARTSESPEPLLSSSRAASSPATAAGATTTTANAPLKPSLRKLYRTYRRQKQLADRYRLHHTPPTPSLSERILSTGKTAWKETARTAKKLSPVSAFREQLETYQAQREQKRREAMKKNISGPVQQSQSDYETAREYMQNEQAMARFAETSSSQPSGAGTGRGTGRGATPRVGAATVTSGATGVGLLSPSMSSLANRRREQRRPSLSLPQLGRWSSTNVTTDSLGSRRTVFTEHLDEDDDDGNHHGEQQDDRGQHSIVPSPMSFACAGDEPAELPGSSSAPVQPLSSPGITAIGSNINGTTTIINEEEDQDPIIPTDSLSRPRSLTAAIQCTHCQQLTGYEETGLCEICSSVYFASVPNPNRIPATPTTVTSTTRHSERDSLVPSPLFSQRGSSQLSDAIINNNNRSVLSDDDDGFRPVVPSRPHLPFLSNSVRRPRTADSSHSSLQRSPSVSPINIRSILPSPPRASPSHPSQQSSPRFDPQLSPSTSSSRSPPPSYSSRGFNSPLNSLDLDPFRDFSRVTRFDSRTGPRTRTRSQSLSRSQSLTSPALSGSEQSYGGVALPSYRDTLIMSPVSPRSSESPGTPLPEYTPRGRGQARGSSPSSIVPMYESRFSSDASLGIRLRGMGMGIRPRSMISTRYSTGSTSDPNLHRSGNGTDNGTRMMNGGVTRIVEMDEELVEYANSPAFVPSGHRPRAAEEEEGCMNEDEMRRRRDEVSQERRRGQRRGVFSRLSERMRRHSVALIRLVDRAGTGTGTTTEGNGMEMEMEMEMATSRFMRELEAVNEERERERAQERNRRTREGRRRR